MNSFLASLLAFPLIVMTLSFSAPVEAAGVPGVMDFSACWNVPEGVPVNQDGCMDLDQDGIPDGADVCPLTPFGAPVDVQGCPFDSDDDGVIDYYDECSRTPSGVAVTEVGCPLDSDWDGVPDYLDACPRTPHEIKVDLKGCPLDADGDGVPDYLDQCPATPRGVKRDDRGCWVLNLSVLFEPGKSELQPAFHEELDKVAALMRQGPSKMEVQGHTDNQIKESYFPHLDMRRAQAVANYLVYRGVDPSALILTGFGPEKPVADNAKPEGLARNNRVELHPR